MTNSGVSAPGLGGVGGRPRGEPREGLPELPGLELLVQTAGNTTQVITRPGYRPLIG